MLGAYDNFVWTGAYNIFVENFMVKDVKYIWYGMTYKQLKEALKVFILIFEYFNARISVLR